MADGRSKDGWRETDSETFIDCGQYFVPHRARQIQIIRDMTPAAVPGDGYVELCCGEGRSSAALLAAQPNARVLAFDGSETMRAATVARLAPFGGRAEVAAFDLLSTDWRQLPFAPLAIVSSLAIHHLDGPQKQTLFADLYRSLKPGGRLNIADLVECQSRAANGIAAWCWDEATKEASPSHDGPDDAYAIFVAENWNYYSDPEPDPIDKPSPLLAQLQWLQGAGFVEVDVHWLLAGHAIFSGRKEA